MRVGFPAEEAILNGGLAEGSQNIHLDKLVLGCGGVSAEGISHFDVAETEVRKDLVQNSDFVILAADHTKLERRKAILLGELDILDVLVTSEEPPERLRRALDQASVEVIIAGQ